MWLSFGLGLLAFCYARFRFSALASEKVSKKVRRESVVAADTLAAADAAGEGLAGGLRLLPRVTQVFSGGLSLSVPPFRRMTSTTSVFSASIFTR